MPERGRRARVLRWLRLHDDVDELELRQCASYIQTGAAAISAIGEGPQTANPHLHIALQDLADQIVWDLHLACQAFDDPDIWYPGVDEGIEPVSDEHVRLVIWASQRELNRELRAPRGISPGSDALQLQLPAAPLAELPWRVQRAFAERRRLRYLQWGITREAWQTNRWRVSDVPEDPDWEPEWPPGALAAGAWDLASGSRRDEG